MVSNLFYPLNSRGKQHKNMSGWVFVTVDGLFFSSHWHKVELALRRSGGRLWEKGPFRKDKFNKMLGWRYHFQTAQCWWLLRFVRGEKRKNWFTFSWGYTGKGGGVYSTAWKPCIEKWIVLCIHSGLRMSWVTYPYYISPRCSRKGTALEINMEIILRKNKKEKALKS